MLVALFNFYFTLYSASALRIGAPLQIQIIIIINLPGLEPMIWCT